VTKIPTTQKLTLAAIDETQIPAFEYREPFFTEAFDKDWAASLKINGHHAHLDMTTGGHVVYGRFVHTFDELVPPTLYKDHPEYFPLREGKRKSGYVQRCLTNADVLKLSIAKVKQWIDENPEATIFSVSQNDVGEWCECDHCKELTAKYGGHSGLYLWFVNQVGDAIVKEHPDKLIDTLAYQFTEAAPKDISPSANVRIRLCPINCCEAHPYEQCSHDANKAFLKNLAAWHQVAKTLYIWHYNTDFANYLQPFPDFKEFPAEARLYQKSGVIGVFFQGAYAPGGGGSDAELRSYVMAKLLWNTDVDTDALVTEWMDGVYGPAAKPLRAWFDLLHEKVADKNQHFFIYSPPTIYYLTDDILGQGDKLFDEAEKLVADNPLQKEYVDKARLSLRCVKLQHHPTDGPEFQSFMKDVRRFGITQLNEGRPVDQWEKDYLAPLKKKT
jgi:hypothetical protein